VPENVDFFHSEEDEFEFASDLEEEEEREEEEASSGRNSAERGPDLPAVDSSATVMPEEDNVLAEPRRKRMARQEMYASYMCVV